MGQIVIRNLDDEKLARLKARAKAENTSVEALARAAVHKAATWSIAEKLALARRLREAGERAVVPGVPQTPGWQLIREDRDADH